MPRISVANNIQEAPEKSRDVLESINKKLGKVPNMYLLASKSPAALKALSSMGDELSRGRLDVATRERIALAIAEVNECNYCLAAHSFIGQNLIGLNGAEIAANRAGKSIDVKADAAVRFAVSASKNSGQITEETFDELVHVGFSEAEMLEIIAHVALNTFTNLVNEVFKTEIDFPVVEALSA